MYSDLTTQIIELSRTKGNFRHGESHESNIGRQPTNTASADLKWLGGETVRHGQSDDSSNGQQQTNESRVKQQWLSGELIHLKSGVCLKHALFLLHYIIVDVNKHIVFVYQINCCTY